jgi:hypothetical protein
MSTFTIPGKLTALPCKGYAEDMSRPLPHLPIDQEIQIGTNNSMSAFHNTCFNLYIVFGCTQRYHEGPVHPQASEGFWWGKWRPLNGEVAQWPCEAIPTQVQRGGDSLSRGTLCGSRQPNPFQPLTTLTSPWALSDRAPASITCEKVSTSLPYQKRCLGSLKYPNKSK